MSKDEDMKIYEIWHSISLTLPHAHTLELLIPSETALSGPFPGALYPIHSHFLKLFGFQEQSIQSEVPCRDVGTTWYLVQQEALDLVQYCCVFLGSPGWVLGKGLVVKDRKVGITIFFDPFETPFDSNTES